MTPFFITLSDAMREVMTRLQDETRKELRQQGHFLTGTLNDSIQFEINATDQNVTGRLFGADYGVFMEFGVPAERIPFGGGRGGKSKYIQGLVRFFQLRGLDDREALRAAFATARVHKREGMPTRGSFAFSANGKRTGFLQSTVERLLPEFVGIIENKVSLQLELTIIPDVNFEPIKYFI